MGVSFLPAEQPVSHTASPPQLLRGEVLVTTESTRATSARSSCSPLCLLHSAPRPAHLLALKTGRESPLSPPPPPFLLNLLRGVPALPLPGECRIHSSRSLNPCGDSAGCCAVCGLEWGKGRLPVWGGSGVLRWGGVGATCRAAPHKVLQLDGLTCPQLGFRPGTLLIQAWRGPAPSQGSLEKRALTPPPERAGQQGPGPWSVAWGHRSKASPPPPRSLG